MEQKENPGSYWHILKYTSLFGGIQGLNILISIVRNKLVALILGPGGMGLIALFSSTIKLISDSTNLGIATSSVKNISEAYGEGDSVQLSRAINTLRSWAFITALAGMLLCMLVGPLLNSATFTWGDHTIHYVMLSPVVGMMAITGGEMAILKGTRRLRSLALVSVLNVLLALFTSVPLYYLWGQRGIVPSLIVMALTQMALTVAYSYRFYPLHLSFHREVVADGAGMARLGIAFVLAGILGSGAEFLIRSYLNVAASLETVGLYNAGYMMTMTYAGMVFSAMETDYFPRLSAVNGQKDERNLAINRQIEVLLLIVSPMLVAFIIGLPVIIPILYSGKFMGAISMIQIVTLAVYMRAVVMPIQYLPLARGDSWSYLFLEFFYDVAVVGFVVLLFGLWELWGAGLGIVMASLLDLSVTLLYARYRYGYSLSRRVLSYLAIQLPVGIAAYGLTLSLSGWGYWAVGLFLTAVSMLASLRILRQKTALWNKLKEKLIKKLPYAKG